MFEDQEADGALLLPSSHRRSTGWGETVITPLYLYTLPPRGRESFIFRLCRPLSRFPTPRSTFTPTRGWWLFPSFFCQIVTTTIPVPDPSFIPPGNGLTEPLDLLGGGRARRGVSAAGFSARGALYPPTRSNLVRERVQRSLWFWVPSKPACA